MHNALIRLLKDLKDLRRDVKAEKVSQIARISLRRQAELIGSTWFSDIHPILADNFGIQKELLATYSAKFAKLIKLSAPNNRRKSYIEVLQSIIVRFRDELILPLQQVQSTPASLSLLQTLLKGLPNPQEDEYLQEAVHCAVRGYFRASVVLGWCAAIERIHRKIESVGFSSFNVTSAQMASQQQGRFKRFSSVQNVNSISEIREVFDNIVLWVIEGMGLIDSNQHTRLRSCFDLRCQCAHPGDAPVTEYNLMSFFSDLNTIIFRNSKFQTHIGSSLQQTQGGDSS